MKLELTLFTLINTAIAGMTLSLTSIVQTDTVEPSLARMAVQNKVKDSPLVTGATAIRFTNSCAQPDGVVVGLGSSASTHELINGVPVNNSIQFSYRARVSSSCQLSSPDCYSVDELDINGSRSVSPRI